MQLLNTTASSLSNCFKKYAKLVILAISLFILMGCSLSIDGDAYKKQQPTFDLYSFFDGPVTAWGIVQNRSGEVVQRFVVTIDGSVVDDKLILDETFEYGLGDGPIKRIWTITKNADGTFTGRAGDIASDATGTSFGNAFNFVYEMDLDVDESTYRVNFDDWFWAFDNKQIMNRSYIKKFGIVMAEVTIFMQRQDM
jgi:hypothetical protein